jgi:hypothetical protein
VFADSVLVATLSVAPYQTTITLPEAITAGMHAIRVVAYDDVENMGETQVSVSVPSTPTGAWLRIADPVAQQVIQRNTPSYRVGVELGDPSSYSRLELYEQQRIADTSVARLVGIVPEPTNSVEAFAWTIPSPGEYLLTVVAVPRDPNATSANSGGVIVRIE